MGKDWLLLSSGGCLWGVARQRVRAVTADAGGYRIDLEECVITADEVLSFTTLSGMTGSGPVLSSLAPRGCVALALQDERPVVVIDAARPPSTLVAADSRVDAASAGDIDEDFNRTD